MSEHLLDPAVFSHRNLKVDNINLHYVIGGKGPVLLLMHGFLATWYSWRKVMPELARDYTVVAPDLRGFGDSDMPQDGYDAATMAEDCRAIIKHEFPDEHVIIMAHDMGAPPALVYSGTYPDEVKALVYFENPVLTAVNLQQLIQFTPQGTRKGGLWWWALAFAGDMPERLIVGHERQFLTWFYQMATHDHGISIEEKAINEYLRTFKGRRGVLGAFGIYRDVFKSAEQTEKFIAKENNLTVPVLALGGELTLGNLVPTMLRGVAVNVKAHIVPNCGHFIQEEKPQELLAAFKAFVEELS